MRRGGRRRTERSPESLRRRQSSGNQPGGGTLDITLDAGDLAGKAQPWQRPQPELLVDEPRAVEESVAVEPAKPCELGIAKARNGPEDPHLLAMLQLGLEPHHIVERADGIVLPQLD